MKAISRLGRGALLASSVVLLVVLFGVVLALRALPDKSHPSKGAGAPINPLPTLPIYQTPVPPVPTIAASCPDKPFTFHQVAQATGGPAGGLGVTPSGDSINGIPTGSAIGLIKGAYEYYIGFGEIINPASMQGEGFFAVTIGPADYCLYDQGYQQGMITPIPTYTGGDHGLFYTATPTGGIIVTAIAGEVITYKTPDGQSGHFNYVTGQFTP